MFDETKHKIILSHGSADNAIVKFTTVARNVRLLPVHTLEDALVHVMLNVQQTLLQFVNAAHLRLIYSLLDVIDRIKVGAIRRPQIWRNETGC